jgi:hypothetical protein
MHREPHRRRVGLRRLHAMADMRGNLDPVAGLHVDAHVAFLEAQAGRTGQQHDEFIVRLVVPEARLARLPGRDDALDTQPRPLCKKVDLLFGLTLRQRREEIAAAQARPQSLKPAGASQGLVPISPGTETSRISMVSEVRISLWRR